MQRSFDVLISRQKLRIDSKNIWQKSSKIDKKQQQLKLLKDFMKVLPIYIQTLHKAYFFYNPQKYHLSKRLFNIDYIMISNWFEQHKRNAARYPTSGYRVLSLVTFLQIILSLTLTLNDIFKTLSALQLKSQEQIVSSLSNDNNVPSIRTINLSTRTAVPNANTETNSLEIMDADSGHHSKAICVLCLEPRSYCSSTPCGHLFCWSCVLDWLDEQEVCPVCKESVHKSNIIQLRNYR